MSGKSVFSQYECIEIRKLLRKIRKADSERQKALRNKLRTNFLFYISDFDKSNSGFTLNDFEHLIKTGRILINLKHDPRNLPPVIELHETLLRQCIWLRSCYNSSELLFDTEDVENTALLIFADARFFEKLSEIFQEYIFILISRLTDKPKNRQNENVSIQSMNKELCEIGLMTQEIKDLSDKLMDYSNSHIRNARNKIIVHADRKTLKANNTLGEHAAEEAKSFFRNLQNYMDSVGRSIGVGPNDFSNADSDSDGSSLLVCLREFKRMKGLSD